MNKQIKKSIEGLKEGDKINLKLNTIEYSNIKYLGINYNKNFIIIELNNRPYSIPLDFIVSISF